MTVAPNPARHNGITSDSAVQPDFFNKIGALASLLTSSPNDGFGCAEQSPKRHAVEVALAPEADGYSHWDRYH